MRRRPSLPLPSRNDLARFDRADLLALFQDLYASGKDNQHFMHARLNLGDDVLGPYKDIIERWLWPDVYKNQDVSVSKAKKAITDYKKASGHPDALAELMVFYCEQATGFCMEVGFDGEAYFDALVRMFEQALKALALVADAQRPVMLDRLDTVRYTSHNFGYGVGDDMDNLLKKYHVDG